MTESISKLENWHGSFPGEHEYSELDSLELNPELEVFMGAAAKLIDEWQGNKFVGLYLYGTPGNGKTHAAVGLGRVLAENDALVHYQFVPSFTQSENQHQAIGLLSAASRSVVGSSAYGHIECAFPEVDQYGLALGRKARSVFILDDYEPAAQKLAMDTIESAAQYGGAVIITSNDTDPFLLTGKNGQDEGLESMKEALEDDLSFGGMLPPVVAGAFGIRVSELVDNREKELARLRSRVAGAFKLIEFTGPDRRPDFSFWR